MKKSKQVQMEKTIKVTEGNSRTTTAAAPDPSSNNAELLLLFKLVQESQSQIKDLLDMIKTQEQSIKVLDRARICLIDENKSIVQKVLSLESEKFKLTNRIKILEKNLNDCKSKITTHEISPKDEILTKKVTELEKQCQKVNDIQNNMISLAKRLDNLPINEHGHPPASAASISQLHQNLTEQHERLKRSSNIILMGVPEREAGEVLKTCKEVLNVILPENSINPWNNRIGAKQDGKVRPIRVRLDGVNQVQTAIINNKLLKYHPELNGIYIRRDETILQRQQRLKRRNTRPPPTSMDIS